MGIMRRIVLMLAALALLWLVGGVQFGAQAGAETAGPRLWLRGGAFDPLVEPPLGATQAAQLQAGNGLHLVQFSGPVQDAWLQALLDSGLQVVGYLPDYAYLAWGDPEALQRLAQTAPLRWSGDYRPAYALDPQLAQAGAAVDAPADVIVQWYSGSGAALEAHIRAAGESLGPAWEQGSLRTLALRLPSGALAGLAALPGVVNVEPRSQFERLDEVQAQIMAGNLAAGGAQPAGPGYLSWLRGLGFSEDPAHYPVIDLTDDGIDSGSDAPLHPDFYRLGDPALDDRLAYNVNWTNDMLADGLGGHGTLNASVAAGYNDRSGPANQDASGYQYGLGINPFGRIAGSKVFSNAGVWGLSGDNYPALLAQSYSLGARIVNNSWGDSASRGSYRSSDAAYDRLVRDADAAAAGLQEMVIIFSAGNAGPLANTSTSPGNAKNVLSIGAAESYRPDWSDGCGASAALADNALQMAVFSSRGPTDDGRVRPDLVAPGTHIQGAAAQASGYTGDGICDPYHPAGQTLYGASSGTSHSAPAAAGAASLLSAYYSEHYGGLPPSPAMVKAYLANSARPLPGSGGAETLPSNNQGWGMLDLGTAFDGASRLLVDQSEVLTATGSVLEFPAQVVDTGLPVRVSLAWTDPPGLPLGAAYVNNLDLEVEFGGQTYLGNVFSGSFSTSGGAADPRNNLESVYLPAGAGGQALVRVRATNLPGDGLPGNGDPSDQDFALVGYNLRGPTGVLSGTVTATGAGALGGASLQASGLKRNYVFEAAASGVYSLPLPAGVYTLTAWQYGYLAQSVGGVVITDNWGTRQDFSLAPAAMHLLEGCVLDAATAQGLDASLSLSGPFSQPLTTTQVTRSAACFAWELPAGSYRLRAESRLHQAQELRLDLQSDLQQDLALTALTTDGVLYGTLSGSDSGGPLAGAGVLAQPGGRRAFSAAGGGYELQLPPGFYTLTVDAPFYATLTLTNILAPQSNLLQLDAALAGSQLHLTPPDGLEGWAVVGAQSGQNLWLHNQGAAGAHYALYPTSGQPPDLGPDLAGYVALDSRTHSEVRYAWVDAFDGTNLFLGDDGEASLTLPFPFTFYGKTSTALRVGNNGLVLFGATSGEISHLNTPLGSANQDYLLAPFWDDLDSDTGLVTWKVLGSAPHRQFVVAWISRPHYSNIGNATFEMVLYEGSSSIKFQYQDVSFDHASYDSGASATVGIRGIGPRWLSFGNNQALLADEMALCFQAAGSPPCDPLSPPPWLSLTNASAWLPGGAAAAVQLNYDTAALVEGQYPALLRLSSSDPALQPYIDLPLTLTVGQGRVLLPLILVTHAP